MALIEVPGWFEQNYINKALARVRISLCSLRQPFGPAEECMLRSDYRADEQLLHLTLRLHMKQVLILLIIVLGLAVGDVNPTPQKHRLGNIKNSKIADGCGCYFQFPNSQRNSEKYMFFSSIEGSEEKEAAIARHHERNCHV